MSENLQPDLIAAINALVEMRLEMIRAENFEDAKRIAKDLSTKGIALTDGLDAETGERMTTWTMKG